MARARGGRGAPAGVRRDASFFRRRRPLLAVTVGGALAETVLVAALGARSALGFAPQGTAPPPFGVLHDLRWLLVYHASWTALAVELAAFVAVRGALTAVLLRSAWPSGAAVPSWGVSFRRGTAFSAVMAILLAPWAAFLFSVSVVPVSWLFFVGLPTTLFIAVLAHHGLVCGRWLLHAPPMKSVGWLVMSFVVLTLAAVVMTTQPVWVAVAAGVATGVFNAWAWDGIVATLVRRGVPARPVPLAAVGIAVGLAAVVAATIVAFQLARSSSDVEDRVGRSTARRGRPVLVAGGFNSTWDGRPTTLFGDGYVERRFSYRGLGADGRPLPYGADSTHRSLAQLTAEMERQVEALYRTTGRRVAVVGESEGALVSKLYVVSRPSAPVDELVMLSPLLRPARTYYPPPGAEGWGVGTGWTLRGVSGLLRSLTSYAMPVDSPFARSMLANAPLLWPVMDCPVVGVDQRIFFPLADAVAAPYATAGDVAVSVIPAFHGGLAGDDAVREAIALALRGHPVPEPVPLGVANLVIRGAAAAWHVPMLAQTLNPAWAPVALADGETTPTCEDVAAALTVRLAGA